MKRGAVALAALCALLSLSCFAIPMYVIRPWRSQGATEFPIALAIRGAGPLVSAVCVALAAALALIAWRSRRTAGRAGLLACILFASLGAWLTRVNIFEIMFKPYGPATLAWEGLAGRAPKFPMLG